MLRQLPEKSRIRTTKRRCKFFVKPQDVVPKFGVSRLEDLHNYFEKNACFLLTTAESSLLCGQKW